jgi:hypothetical protein
MEARLKLSKLSTEPTVDQTLYRSLVGSLRYLLTLDPILVLMWRMPVDFWKILMKIIWAQ